MYTLCINNGLVIDPERKIAFPGSVGVLNGKIAEISASPLQANVVLDAHGSVICPGFIDVHGHVDGISTYKDVCRCAQLSLLEGVTSMVSGNCGASVMDVSEFLTRMDAGFPFHHGELIGGSTLRRAVGLDDIFKPATPKQIEEMCALAEKAMQDGAVGISFGLGYTPGTSMEETFALGRVAKKYGRIVTVDTGMEDDYDLHSLEEAFEIARTAKVRVQVSHLVYQYGECVMKEALEMLDQARADGIDVWSDSGLYVDWATGIGSECFRESFIYAQQPSILPDLLVATGEHKGMRLDDEMYRHMRAEHKSETVIRKTHMEPSMYLPYTPEREYIMPSSDTAPYNPGEGHPQIAGTFPAFFRMVREKKNLELCDAVYRATLLPARVMGFETKGRMEIGMDADLVVFNPETICDRAAYVDEGAPDAPPIGVEYVIVNGGLAVEGDRIVNDHLGCAMRK